jgi:thioredoxin-related protein
VSIPKFLTIVAAVLVAGLAVRPVEAAPPFVVESLDMDFQYEIEAAAEEDKNLVIFFHQLGCPYCDKMRARVFPDPEVMEYFNERFIMIESNIKGALPVVTPEGEEKTEKEFARQLRVRATPVMTFYGQDGKLALRTTGYQDPKRFIKAGEYVRDGVYKDGTSFFRYLRDSAGK